MGLEFYLFAIFCFALVAILIVIFVWGIKKRKTEQEVEQDEKYQKATMLYFEVEEMIDALKEYVEASREKIEQDIRRIETDMRAMNTVKESVLSAQRERVRQTAEVQIPQIAPQVQAEEPVEEEESPGQLTFTLDADGGDKDIDELAKKMDLSKTEVALMLKMKSMGSPDTARKK